MCVVCKDRFHQSELLRFQTKEGKPCAFTHNGRSFYLCKSCVDGNVKGLKKAILQRCGKIDYDILDYGKMLKEILVDGQS